MSSVDGCPCCNKQIDYNAGEFPDSNILLNAHTLLQQVQNVGSTSGPLGSDCNSRFPAQLKKRLRKFPSLGNGNDPFCWCFHHLFWSKGYTSLSSPHHHRPTIQKLQVPPFPSPSFPLSAADALFTRPTLKRGHGNERTTIHTVCCCLGRQPASRVMQCFEQCYHLLIIFEAYLRP